MKNPYIPYPVTVEDIRIENDAKDLKSFKLVFDKDEDREAYTYTPGQFGILSVFGKGECPIGIASSPTEGDHLLFTVKRMGSVTTHLHNAEPGMKMGVRGPMGNSYPLDKMKGRNVVIIGGGFAFTTLRSTINYMLDSKHRGDYEKLIGVYGARSPGELLYKQELKDWEGNSEIDMHVTVDKGDEGWKGREGFVPTVTKEVGPSPDNAIVLVCGPPIMIRFTIPVLLELGFTKDDIILSLEMRMKCGIGKCGRCNIGKNYVCTEGPVFSLAELEELPDEY
ncbi:FAD/NAD(P)-binding protein [Planctomycetota bacterium]